MAELSEPTIIAPQLSRQLSRQRSLALLNVPKVSPGTWLTTPCLNPLNRFNHHFIAIHPLLYIGYNGREVCMVNIWGEITAGQEKKYVTKKWKIVHEPKTPQHAALIITRAISRLGERQYNGLTNNCEHYVHWCFTGYSTSAQIHESVINGISSGSAAVVGTAIGAASVPTVAVIGSSQIGAAGVVLGSTAVAASWPFMLVGGLVGALVGYGVPKVMEVYKKTKYRRKLREKMYKRRTQYTMEMMEEVRDVQTQIEEIAANDAIDKNDLEELSIALNDGVFRILDKHFHRDQCINVTQTRIDDKQAIDDMSVDGEENTDLLHDVDADEQKYDEDEQKYTEK